MADERVVKVFHAARQDLEIVWNQAQLIPHPIFDTQVAAMVCGFGESVSYVNLVKQVTRPRPRQDLALHGLVAPAAVATSSSTYALADVTHLRDIYRHLKAELEKRRAARSWLDEEMATLIDPRTYETHPEEAWRRLKLRVKNRKGLAVLIELAAWRERAAQAPGRAAQPHPARRGALRHRQPRADRDVAALRAAHAERRLCQARPAPRRSSRRSSAGWRAIPRPCRRCAPARRCRPRRWRCVDLLRVLLKACAARHKVAPRLIADGDDLERIAVEDAPDVPAMKGWRYDLFGARPSS